MNLHTAAIAALGLFMANNQATIASDTQINKSVERYYCTQFGPFSLRFDSDKAAGVFAIFANGDLGSIVGHLRDHHLEGEWIEVDSRGKIKIDFSDDWSSFKAAYNVAPATGNWRTGWYGRLRPESKPSEFTVDGQTYKCAKE